LGDGQPATTTAAAAWPWRQSSAYSSSYLQELYGDPEFDPCHGNYDQIMAHFDVDINPSVTPTLLYEQAVGTSAPQAYLCCTMIQQEVKIFCVHLPSKFVSAMDGTVTPWDVQGFAFLGEITQTMVTTVSFPNTAFRAVMNTQAKSSEYIITHLRVR
jgi:hypothetical protein